MAIHLCYPVPKLRYSRRDETFITPAGALIEMDDGGMYFAALETVSPLRLSELRAAFARRLNDTGAESERLLVSPVAETAFDVDVSIALPVFLEASTGRVYVGIEAFLERATWTEDLICEALEPAARRAGLVIDTVTLDTAAPSLSSVVTFPSASPSHPPEAFVNVLFEVRARGLTVGRAIQIGEALGLLLDALDSDGITARAAFEWVRLGHPELLIDQYESAFLEVKAQPYDLNQMAGKVEFAEVVAALANGSTVAVLIVGLKTVNHSVGDRITQVTPVHFTAREKQAWRQILSARIFPTPEGLEWAVAKTGADRAVVAVLVPPQDDKAKPFLVQGTMVGRKYRTTFVSIPRRTHDGTKSATAEWIHAKITSG